jgi:predicted NUDIX family phosphoesterase
MVQVFVADRAAFFGGAWPQGFLPLAGGAAHAFLARVAAAGRFAPRPDAERTPAWKQWIPYCVVRCSDSAGPLGVFCVRRSKGQGEARLHGKWSIGLGGHVEPCDLPAGGSALALDRALWRELHEELHVDLTEDVVPQFLGLLNDDATEVGSVHAGLVYRLDVTTDLATARRRISIREISKMLGGFASLAEFANLWQDPSQFESWSQILVRAEVVGPMAASADLQEHPSGG